MRFGRKQRRPDRPLIFVCSPYRGDTETNVQNARRYCRLVVEQGGIPFAPHLLFTQFLNEDKVAERRRGLWMGMEMLRLCDELWAFGEPTEECAWRLLRLSGWASRYAGWTWREVWRMNDKCFALRTRGVCGALSGDCSRLCELRVLQGKAAAGSGISAGRTRGSGGCRRKHSVLSRTSISAARCRGEERWNERKGIPVAGDAHRPADQQQAGTGDAVTGERGRIARRRCRTCPGRILRTSSGWRRRFARLWTWSRKSTQTSTGWWT